MKENYMKYGSIFGSKYSVQTEYGEWDIVFTMEKLDEFIGQYYKKLKKGGTIIMTLIYGRLHAQRTIKKHNFKQIRFIEWIKTYICFLSKTNYLTNCREIALVGVKGGKPTFNGSDIMRYINILYKVVKKVGDNSKISI